MLHVFLGTDTPKALKAINSSVLKLGMPAVRVSDASSIEDVRAAIAGGGMFAQKRAVVLDRLSDNDELWQLVVDELEHIALQSDHYFLYEEKADATAKRVLQKYADDIAVFDAPKAAKSRPTVFALVNHMQSGDKKKLWVGYQQELALGNAPEAIHGTLFWGVKQALLRARITEDVERSKRLLVELAELPHASRRSGEELEYALERFILTEI